jgi:hypothetical protein
MGISVVGNRNHRGREKMCMGGQVSKVTREGVMSR